MSVDTKNKKMTIEIRKRQMGFHSLTVHKDSNSGFKKEANTEVPKYLHSILWPAGTTKKWLQKDKKMTGWQYRGALRSHVGQFLFV